MSPHELLRDMMRIIGSYQPRSLLDVGMGFGPYGYLTRYYFDFIQGRFSPDKFQIRIDGIEVYEPYISDIQRLVYSNVYIGDAFEVIDRLGKYDVVIAVEVIEHFEKKKGHQMIGKMLEHADKAVIITTLRPENFVWQKAMFGNEYETHKSVWAPEEWAVYGGKITQVVPSYIVEIPKYPDKVGVAVVTYNRLDLLKRCFPTWRKVRNSILAIWDNASDEETVRWLKRQDIDKLFLSPTNRGMHVGRNRVIQWFLDEHPDMGFILVIDSDVELLDGAVENAVRVAYQHPDAGIISYPQANKGFPVGAGGYVEEVAGEFHFTRADMWKEVKYPESLVYYSGDSWMSTVANMCGWRTVLVMDAGEGYIHHAHGSQGNPGVKGQAEIDAAKWAEKEAQFIRYWQVRLEKGKGNQYVVGDTKDG